ncbi:MAG: RIP metalloprotease RseP [Pseudomonadaceae bacterium]|nr:RIP metalloprotease RseP [Pseudomonadaceae bacterium]
MTAHSDWLTRLAEFAQQYPYGDTVFTVALFLVVLSILVFFHELGHYAAARSVGIRVEAFSIGFGREIFGWNDKHGTRWKFGWLPLGGYVQMRGQEDLKPIEQSVDPVSFASKTLLQRAWVIVAGPLANLVLGFVLLVAVMLTGEHKLKAEIGEILPDMPAAAVLQAGDVVTAVNGEAVADWDALQTYVSDRAGQELVMTVQRGGQDMAATLVPQTTTFTDLLGDTHTVGRIGVAPSYSTFVVHHGLADGLWRAAERTYELTALTVKSLYKLLIGAIGADNLSGPLGIANMTGQAASSGTFALLMFMTMISINLCIVNLFPLPILDGGHLVFLALEGVRGRPLGAVAQEWMMRVGLALIVMLALFSTFNDTKRMGWFGGRDEAVITRPAE